MLRTLSKMMPTQARRSSGEYDMASNDQLWRLAMSENRRLCDTSGNAGTFWRDGPGSHESADTDVLRDGVDELAGEPGMASSRCT